MVPQRPFFMGKPGWVRSSAWIWLFSSARSPVGEDSDRGPPHRSTFKRSRDAKFLEVERCGGPLSESSPTGDRADEKSQTQALDRTQPGLPMKKGRCGTMTHDYKRNGTTTLFAALNTLNGSVIETCMPKHRHQEFLRFLRRLDHEFPPDLDLHLILDNYGTHKGTHKH